MQRLFVVLAIFVMAVASSAASAQTYTFNPPDPSDGGYGGVLRVDASWPHGGNFVYTRSVVVSGNSVMIRFVQDGGNYSPNPPTIESSITTPRLAAGIYT